MSSSECSRAPRHRIVNASLIGLLLAGASCGGGSSGAKTDAGTTPGTDSRTGSGGIGGSGSGGSGGGGGGTGIDAGPIGTTPPEQCTGLVSIICARLVECRGVTTTVQAQCNRVLNVELGCDRATSTEFAACIQDTRILSCGSVFTANGLVLPGTCDAPLTIPPSDAQTKCLNLVAADCTRSYQCSGVATPTPVQVQDCVDQVQIDPMGIACIDVTVVGPNYAACLSELMASPCPPPTPDGGAPDAGAPDAGPVDAGTNPIPSCSGILTFVQ